MASRLGNSSVTSSDLQRDIEHNLQHAWNREWMVIHRGSQGGEMELVDIAKMSGFLDTKGKRAFDASLEMGVPPLVGASC